MPIQIIESNRKPTTSENFGKAFSGLVNAYTGYSENQSIMKEKQRKKKIISEMFGEDFADLDPDLQKLYIGEKLKGENSRNLENLKSENKNNLAHKKEEYLNKLFGGQNNDQFSQENPNQKSFDPSMISDEDIARASTYDPNLARSLQHSKDVALREKRSQQEYDLKALRASPEHKREEQLSSSQASADVKYNQTLQEVSKQHELKEQSLDRLEKLNQKGVTGKPYEKILEKTGLVNLTSDGRREFAADVKNLITDIRSILGGQFSNFEFQTILNAYPSADFSKEANAAIIKNLKGFQDIKKKEVEFATQLKKENGGKIPFDFQSQINEKVREYAASKLPEIKKNAQRIMSDEYGITPGNILMLDPNGEPLDVSPDDVERLESLGATLP